MSKGARPGYLSKVNPAKRRHLCRHQLANTFALFSHAKQNKIKAKTMRGPKSIVLGHKAREYVIKVENIENGNGNGNRAANEADVDPRPFMRVLRG